MSRTKQFGVVNHKDPAFIRSILTDTGEMAREVLGFNYDEDGGHRINVGTGGIRNYGKTQEIIQLLDDEKLRYKMVMVPRDGRKSTIAAAYAVRRICKNKNIRIFYVGRTDDIVRPKSVAIRSMMLTPLIEKTFGAQQGPKWEEMEWTVGTRTDHSLKNATFTAFSQDSLITGGRCDLLILDDFIDHTNVTTPEQNKKSKERWKLLVPFIANASEVVVLCTLWADDDLNSDLIRSPLFQPPSGGSIVCGAGVRVIQDGKGGYDVEEAEGGLTFPHLSLPYLREKLRAMSIDGDPRQFIYQYLNEVPAIGGSGFQRSHFRHLQWGPDMEQLSGYLLTDTAIGKGDDACFSVLAYMGLDAEDNLYLLDMDIGIGWEPSEFGDRFFEMLETWQGRVNHVGECWEKIALATAYRDAIENDSRARKTKIRTIELPRPPQSHKKDRIKRLQPPMRNKKFFVVDTIPGVFNGPAGEQCLWNPIGFFDPQKKVWLPSGELVEQFIKESSKKDIPDTLAMILEYEKTRHGHKRACVYKPWRPKSRALSLTEQRADAYHQQRYGPQQSNSDWWDKTLHDHGI